MLKELVVRSLLAVISAVTFASCTASEAATQVIVVVRSDLDLNEELDALEVRLLDRSDLGNSSPPVREYSLTADPREGQHELPLSFTVVPKQNDSRQDFRLVVTGLWHGEVVVEQQAFVSFLPQKALLLEIFLARMCLDKLCRDGRGRRTENACVSATCEQVADQDLMTIDPDDFDETRGTHASAEKDAEIDASETDTELDASMPDGNLIDAMPVDAKAAGPDAHPDGPTERGDGAASSSCQTMERTVRLSVPDLMIVLDRSASMRPPTADCRMPDIVSAFTICLSVDCNDPTQQTGPACGGTIVVDRWAPAVMAIKSLTQMFQGKISLGLTTFPGQGASTQAGQQDGCTPGTLRIPAALNTAGAIASALDMTQPDGFTPTASTLELVLQQIQQRKASPDASVPPQYVLLVTDGAPTCPGNDRGDNNAQAHQATIAAIDALAKAGVKTFVIGYDASVNPTLAGKLTEYAQHGGTNNFFAVQDAPSLVSKFTEIASGVADCAYLLDGALADPARVRVRLDGEALGIEQPNGFTLKEKALTLNGSACLKSRDARTTHTLSVTVECAP